MNKKIIALVVGVMTAAVAVAGPCGGRGCGGWGGGCRPCHPHHGCGGGDFWGKGGRNFWPSFVGGLVGSVVGNAVSTPQVAYAQPTTVVQAQPTYVQPTYAQPVATTAAVAQPVTYAQPAAQQVVATGGAYGYEGVCTNPYQPNNPIVAPAGAVVTADQPIAGRTRVWVQGTYAHKLQGNGTYATQYIPGHYEYQ